MKFRLIGFALLAVVCLGLFAAKGGFETTPKAATSIKMNDDAAFKNFRM